MAMAAEPATRYASAAAFAADLEAFLRDEPVVAREPTPALRLRRFVRQHRRTFGAVVAGAAALALLVVGLQSAGSLAAASRRDLRERLWDAEASGDAARQRAALIAAVAADPDAAELRLRRGIRLLGDAGPADLAAGSAALRRRCDDAPELEPVRALVAAGLALAEGSGTAGAVEQAVEPLLTAPRPDPRVALLAARALLAMNWLTHAETLFARVGTDDARLAALAAEGLASCHDRAGRHVQALAASSAFATLYDTPSRHFAVVRHAHHAGLPEQARRAAGELRARHPDSAFADAASLLLGDGEAGALVAQAAARADHAAAAPAIERILVARYLTDGDVQRAHELLSRFVAEHPRDPNLRVLLGQTLLQSGRRDDGLAELRQAAIDGDRLPFERDSHWGVYRFFAGELDAAIEHFRSSARLRPADGQALRALAMALATKAHDATGTERVALLREIVATHEQEVRCTPTEPRAQFLLAEALRALAGALESRGDPEAAALRRRAEALAPPAGR
jgi:hypothetical protein